MYPAEKYDETGTMITSSNKYTVRGILKFNEPMDKHTTWRTGGVADEYFEPADLDDLSHYLADTGRGRSLLWVGLGSNLLVRDGGFRGTVIAYSKGLNRVQVIDNGVVFAEAGVPCVKVARLSAKQGLTGAEFLVGIPGSIGGALAMNAGAFGSETWNIVNRVKTVDRTGKLHDRKPEEFSIGYRSVKSSGEEWFVSANLELQQDQDNNAVNLMKNYLDKRATTQPIGLPSCGSVFRNPPDGFAAKLIEQCGLKGKRIGNAVISDKHANFIINLGGASANDIEHLIEHTRMTVLEKFNVELTPEVRIIGEQV